MESPFIVKKMEKQSSTDCTRMRSPDKSASMKPLVLMDGNLDEVSDVVHDATKNIWSHIKDLYHETITKV